MDFRVELVEGGARAVVFARPLQEGKVVLSARPTLASVAIKSTFSRLNSTNDDGTPRPSLYAFQLVTPAEIEKFHIGDKVTLS
jgi:hypothetical protein